MRRQLRPMLAGLAGASAAGLAACVALGACASVLGVDKPYELAADAGEDARTSGDAAEDTGQVTTVAEVRCALDAAPCVAATQECCFSSTTDTLACASTATADPCPNGTDIRCDDPSDCDAGVCCLSLDTGNDILGTACEAKCPSGQTELCAPNGATCAGGKTCRPLSVQPTPPIQNPWFYSCQ